MIYKIRHHPPLWVISQTRRNFIKAFLSGISYGVSRSFLCYDMVLRAQSIFFTWPPLLTHPNVAFAKIHPTKENVNDMLAKPRVFFFGPLLLETSVAVLCVLQRHERGIIGSRVSFLARKLQSFRLNETRKPLLIAGYYTAPVSRVSAEKTRRTYRGSNEYIKHLASGTCDVMDSQHLRCCNDVSWGLDMPTGQQQQTFIHTVESRNEDHQ